MHRYGVKSKALLLSVGGGNKLCNCCDSIPWHIKHNGTYFVSYRKDACHRIGRTIMPLRLFMCAVQSMFTTVWGSQLSLFLPLSILSMSHSSTCGTCGWTRNRCQDSKVAISGLKVLSQHIKTGWVNLIKSPSDGTIACDTHTSLSITASGIIPVSLWRPIR